MIEKLCGKDYEYYEDLAGVDGGARALVQSWTRGRCRGARLSRRNGQDNISGLIHARRRRGVPDGESTFDADLNFRSRWDGPLGLLARAMSGLHFYRRGVGRIGGYARVTDCMQTQGVDGRLLPLVILTELGGACWCCSGSRRDGWRLHSSAFAC